MTKEKRQTLNADKRKVIADVFQSHFEDNSKYKKQHQDAITNYNLMREQAKVKMNDLVRFHQPQEDVDTIRKMIAKYNSSGGDLNHDNWFYVQSDTPRKDRDKNGNPIEKYNEVQVKFDDDGDIITYY